MRADQTESPDLAAGTHSTQDHLGPTRCSWRRVSPLNSNSACRDPHETFLRNTLLEVQEWSSHLQSQHWKTLLKILWPEFLNHPNRARIQSHPRSALEAFPLPPEMPTASLPVHLQKGALAVRSLLFVPQEL